MKKLPRNFEKTINELGLLSKELNDKILDRSFYDLPFKERRAYIRRIKHLYSKLQGPVSAVKVKQLLAATAVLALVVPVKVGSGPNASYVSLLSACTLNTNKAGYGSSITRFAIPRALGLMERYDLTISGDGMDTIEESFPGSETSIVLEVPAGEGRRFELLAVVDPADPGSIRRYRGISTVDLEAGSTVDIAMTMEAVPLEPSFEAAVTNPFGLSSLDDHAHPAFVDIDGDGDLDLLVGDYEGSPYYGEVFRYFENTGTAEAPVFAAPVTDPFSLSGLYSNAYLTIGDLDSDGDPDILTGKIGDGYGEFQYFENTGTAAAPDFIGPGSNPYGLSNTTNSAYPTLGDLDGDGDLDLLVGDRLGYPDYSSLFQYFENTGTADTPSFSAAPVQDPFGLTNISDYSVPALVDLDGDGDLDILAGDSSGNFQYFENTGTVDAPAFAVPVPNPFDLTGIATGAVPVFGDLDGDGDLDLLVGGGGTDLRYFENTAL